jgi:prefoldin beta subunit
MPGESKIGQIQAMEQNLQSLLAQKQQFQSALLEIEAAQKEVEVAPTAYKMIGNIMVAQDKKSLAAELLEKRSKTTVRLKSIEKQEEKAKERIKALQGEVMAEMDKKVE